jgi:deazaflavin-dependent oxidoreductase (nitroreductase family)
MRSNPRATIQVKDRRFEVEAEIAGPDKRGQLWTRLLEVAPAYANYAKRTSREIPLVILRPVQT